MKKLCCLVVLVIACGVCRGQNLVPNGDFEQYSGCPNYVDQFDSLLLWTSPTDGSPDYFNACDTGIVNVPSSLYGFQNAHSGLGRGGIVI